MKRFLETVLGCRRRRLQRFRQLRRELKRRRYRARLLAAYVDAASYGEARRILTALMISACAVMVFAGCTVVTANRVFPKLDWCWGRDAKIQRESEAWDRERHREYMRTNQPTTKL